METRSSVSSYLLYLGVPAAQAQELTQETYLRLYQTMRKGQDIQNARAWLFRVAHNLGVKARVRERSIQPADADWERFLASPGDSPERQLLDRERMKQVAAGLDTLSLSSEDASTCDRKACVTGRSRMCWESVFRQ